MKKIELIRGSEEEGVKISFYPVVFMQRSRDMITYPDGKKAYEMIAPEAYSEATDIERCTAVLQHERGKILGRISSGTLQLERDSYGVKATINMGDTSLHKDVCIQVERQDITEGSFKGTATAYRDEVIDGQPVRVITQLTRMKDVALVDDAAYEGAVVLNIARSSEGDDQDDNNVQLQRNNQEMGLYKEFKSSIAGQSNQAALQVKRAADDGSSGNFTNITQKGVKRLDVIGKKPIWAEMGLEYYPNCQGTFTLPYEDPIVAEKLAELASVTKQSETDHGTLVTPGRFTVQKEYTMEALASMTEENFYLQMQNMEQGCDRKITEEVMSKAIAGAGEEVTGVTTLTDKSLDELAEPVEVEEEKDTAYLMSRKVFYKNKSNKIDAGSGKVLMEKEGAFGVTHEGTKVVFSSLFKENDRVVYGDMSRIAMCDYNRSEIIIDKYTKASKGIVIITMHKIATVAVRNPNALSKSATLV